MSNFSRSLTRKEIENIESISQVNNAKEGITGILLSCNRTFFQILEGDEDRIDHLYEKILKDDRHHQVVCISLERNITEKYWEYLN
jgi:adenylate cyclase